MYAPAPLSALQLHATLDSPLPSAIAVGKGSALFVAGTAYCPAGALATLSLLVDGEAQPVIAHSMPRLDFFRASTDPLSYASGFWGMARVGPGRGDSFELGLRAILADGRAIETRLAQVDRVELPEPLHVDGSPRVAICMATYNPPAGLLERQLDSIRAQTHENWVCVISDDGSDPERFQGLERAVGGDPRFVISRSPRRRGFYGNFERALALAPADAEYVAMADQDDFWYPDKLETLLRSLGNAQLVYSDARIVSRDGSVLAESYWTTRRNNHSDLLSVLVANSVTGAASLFRRELLGDALPFPPAQFAHFHDHWVGLVALSLGEIAFVERPLYDYVQHGTASLGHAAATSMTPLSERLANQRALAERVRMWRLHYFVDVCRLWQFATILLTRCGERMTRRKRRTLERFLADSPASVATLGIRGARELVSRRPETLGAEWMLALALLWRRLLSASARPRPQRALRLDAVPPPTLSLKPGGRAAAGLPEVRAIAEKIAPLELLVSDSFPRRVNVLIPTIDLEHFFGGYIAKLNLALRLARHGQRVRIVTTDPVPALPHSWRQTIESYAGLAGLFDAVEVAFGRGGEPLEVSRSDRFIASTWWTAHIAQAAGASLRGAPFLYLIQEYEPFTFPMGTYAALAEESYRFPHFALFSTEFLRQYFRRHGIGVYSRGPDAGDKESVSFQNAITDVAAPRADELWGRRPRRLLFYARPEPHAARNMFELGVLVLARALDQGAFDLGWELNGIGTVREGRELPLAGGRTLTLLPRADQASYAELLREHDLGLALMYTPHPSLVPIEMAAAGLVTVTNTFENKTADELSAISSNLVAADPSLSGLVLAITSATQAVDNLEARIQGADVHWSRSWNESFDDALLERLLEVLA